MQPKRNIYIKTSRYGKLSERFKLFYRFTGVSRTRSGYVKPLKLKRLTQGNKNRVLFYE